jgi:predicted nucleotidyltransferase
VEAELGVSTNQAELVTQAIADLGFCEPLVQKDEAASKSEYSVTKLGSRLCVVRFVKRITRAKADTLVKQMLERVSEINARDELVFRVKRVRAFGSYASDASEVGDIDLAVDWEERHPDRDIIELLLARADASGKRLNTYMARLNYGEVEVERLLKGGSPYISIQSGKCPEKFGVPTIVLFPLASNGPT